jgi:hypothetical protein
MFLDLGDTVHGCACPLKPGWVSIALDDTDKLVGDYNRMPFVDQSFDGAEGGCYLEEPVDFRELYRVLKHDTLAKLFCCMSAFADTQVLDELARRAGFEVLKTLKFETMDETPWRPNDQMWDSVEPMIIYKPWKTKGEQ